MLQLQPNALPPWLNKLPEHLQKRIKDVNRDKQKTWAHKLVELEMINLKIVESSEDSQYAVNGTGQSDYKLGPLSVVPCLNPAALSNTPSKISLYTDNVNSNKLEIDTTDGTMNQVFMCLSQSGYYPFADGLKTIFSSEECYNCTAKPT
uniref:Uncharacterized protein n=1 Tax=Ditylenchus dipsaci TaxID=166011 RepID=A0A915E4A0_9BILA